MISKTISRQSIKRIHELEGLLGTQNQTVKSLEDTNKILDSKIRTLEKEKSILENKVTTLESLSNENKTEIAKIKDDVSSLKEEDSKEEPIKEK